MRTPPSRQYNQIAGRGQPGERSGVRDIEVEVRAFSSICCTFLGVGVREGQGPKGRKNLAQGASPRSRKPSGSWEPQRGETKGCAAGRLRFCRPWRGWLGAGVGFPRAYEGVKNSKARDFTLCVGTRHGVPLEFSPFSRVGELGECTVGELEAQGLGAFGMVEVREAPWSAVAAATAFWVWPIPQAAVGGRPAGCGYSSAAGSILQQGTQTKRR
jgi:hypothetical protein